MQATAAPIRLAGSNPGRYRHVCAFFNPKQDEARTLLDVMRTHPRLIVGGVLQENPGAGR